ncbi:PH domain-containing protein [Nocardioides sp. NPDC057577]|uniref:PH domain-containing protein n=1 Tax=Nocardioides sp. NPDC057577 TaxID=3346171 RepID=UPI00366D2038
MQKQAKVVAFGGRSWAIFMGAGMVWGLLIWTVMFLEFRGALPVPMGRVMDINILIGVAVFGGWFLLRRGRLEVRDDGLALSGPLGSRVVPWSDLTVVEPTWAWQWVRCRDADGRVTLRLTTSRWYPRLQHQIREHNKELATRLWYCSRVD